MILEMSSPHLILNPLCPHEFKVGGTGLKIRYGIHKTPVGECLIATTSRSICNLYFLDTADKEIAEQTLHTEWINSEIICDQQMTKEVINSIFNPVIVNSCPLVLDVKGTKFQIQVWNALLKIPFAEVTTYQDIAASIGRPTATRAVANAIGRNPISYLIPCHRVIRSSGELGGYRWGLERKRFLLEWEAGQKI